MTLSIHCFYLEDKSESIKIIGFLIKSFQCSCNLASDSCVHRSQEQGCVSTRTTLVSYRFFQRGVLEFTSLHNDWKSHLTGNQSQSQISHCACTMVNILSLSIVIFRLLHTPSPHIMWFPPTQISTYVYFILCTH